MNEVTRSPGRTGTAPAEQPNSFLAPNPASLRPNDPQHADVVGAVARSIVYDRFEEYARLNIQDFLQQILEEEVAELLGRSKSDRRDPGCPKGYRNGHGKERQLKSGVRTLAAACNTSIGQIKIRRPRVRGVGDPFVSRVLPLFKRNTREVEGTLPQLYLHGLSSGDFELAMRGLLGEGAPLSATSIARLRAGWQAEYTTWKQRSLAEKDVVYLWVDGIYVKAGLEKDKACLLVAIAGLADGTKEVIAVECGHRESEASWSSLLRHLKSRGMGWPRLVIGDGNLGIWAALSNVFPHSKEQRCWNHRMRNVLDCVGKKNQDQAKELLRKIMYADTVKTAEATKEVFQKWARSLQHEKAAKALDEDWERMICYYSFPKEHWLHLRTTNIIESPFASVRLRTAASKRYKKAEGATAMIWKLLQVAEQTFRKLNAPEMLFKVYVCQKFEDGLPVNQEPKKDNQVAEPMKMAA